MVDTYKYLGYIIQYNLDDSKDIDLRLNKLYAQYYGLKRHFSNVGTNVLFFLVKAFCTPDYGLCLWDWSKVGSKIRYKVIESAYIKNYKTGI